MFTILLLIFSFLHLSLAAQQLSHLQQCLLPLQFPLPDVVTTTDTMPFHWAFYKLDSGLPVSCGYCSVSMCKVHTALQEHQAVAFMLHKMATFM